MPKLKFKKMESTSFRRGFGGKLSPLPSREDVGLALREYPPSIGMLREDRSPQVWEPLR